MLSSRETSFDDYAARSDGASMWMWRAHNIVNARLAREEAEESAANVRAGIATHGSKFPKVQFPTKAACPRCYAHAMTGGEDVWDEIRVNEFLHAYYLADGERREIDLNVPTKVSEILAPMIVPSQKGEARPSDVGAALGDVSVYDVFVMSARFFAMFAVVIFMCIRAGVMKLSRGNRKKAASNKVPTPSPSYDVEGFKAA